ncbi:MAG TPA: HEAT repeat domain-containing protein [Pyrinomonadaceae bacterium]|nr:HEAT repeat domain-containing protein [Pyrinomonadaceae bacterium]
MKIKSIIYSSKFRLLSFLSLFITAAIDIKAQMPADAVEEATEDFTWWYVSLLFLTLCLVGAVTWVIKNKKEAKAAAGKKGKTAKFDNNENEIDALDANKELEWLRKNHNLITKNGGNSTIKVKNNSPAGKAANAPVAEKAGEEKPLPVFSFERLELARPFSPLPISNDEALISAIEQTYDEFEEDEEVRDIALRILTAFRTRNSVEALSQIALYDLSSTLRSKAVTILSEFNHESVFEPILQATADPTREVRAAAARALSKLTIDRSDAWTRIFETEEEGRMRQVARAATESGFVEMSFERLVHPDEKYSYEAFTLMALLIKAGETEEIFRTLETHKNMNVRRAILHVIKITKNQKALDGLYSILEKKTLPLELQEEVDKTIEEIGFVTA